MVRSLCLGSLALLLAGVEGARISRKRHTTAVNATVGARTTHNIHINANGNSATREYQYFVPAQCSNSQCPMLLEFHGQYGSIPNVGYDEEAENYGFVMVYLQGMGDGGCGTGWNTIAPGQDISSTCTSPTLSGTCCYDSCSSCSNSNRGCRWATCHDDVTFTAAVLDEMRSAVNVGDIFVTGGSNGGMFTHTLMTTMPETFKGVVSVCGLPLAGQWEPGQYGVPSALSSTSVLYMHGRNDRVIPADGGWAGGWNYVSGAEAMRTLASNHGCASTTSAWSTPYDGGNRQVACVKHDNCPNGVTIAQCLYNGGHSAWPPNGNDLVFWFLTG